MGLPLKHLPMLLSVAGALCAADVTKWNYYSHNGLLSEKVYADNSSIHYTYTPSGNLLRKTPARDV